METGPWLKVSSDRLVKPGIEPATLGLQGKRFIHYTIAALILKLGLIKLSVGFTSKAYRQLYLSQTMALFEGLATYMYHAVHYSI